MTFDELAALAEQEDENSPINLQPSPYGIGSTSDPVSFAQPDKSLIDLEGYNPEGYNETDVPPPVIPGAYNGPGGRGLNRYLAENRYQQRQAAEPSNYQLGVHQAKNQSNPWQDVHVGPTETMGPGGIMMPLDGTVQQNFSNIQTDDEKIESSIGQGDELNRQASEKYLSYVKRAKADRKKGIQTWNGIPTGVNKRSGRAGGRVTGWREYTPVEYAKLLKGEDPNVDGMLEGFFDFNSKLTGAAAQGISRLFVPKRDYEVGTRTEGDFLLGGSDRIGGDMNEVSANIDNNRLDKQLQAKYQANYDQYIKDTTNRKSMPTKEEIEESPEIYNPQMAELVLTEAEAARQEQNEMGLLEAGGQLVKDVVKKRRTRGELLEASVEMIPASMLLSAVGGGVVAGLGSVYKKAQKLRKLAKAGKKGSVARAEMSKMLRKDEALKKFRDAIIRENFGTRLTASGKQLVEGAIYEAATESLMNRAKGADTSLAPEDIVHAVAAEIIEEIVLIPAFKSPGILKKIGTNPEGLNPFRTTTGVNRQQAQAISDRMAGDEFDVDVARTSPNIGSLAEDYMGPVAENEETGDLGFRVRHEPKDLVDKELDEFLKDADSGYDAETLRADAEKGKFRKIRGQFNFKDNTVDIYDNQAKDVQQGIAVEEITHFIQSKLRNTDLGKELQAWEDQAAEEYAQANKGNAFSLEKDELSAQALAYAVTGQENTPGVDQFRIPDELANKILAKLPKKWRKQKGKDVSTVRGKGYKLRTTDKKSERMDGLRMNLFTENSPMGDKEQLKQAKALEKEGVNEDTIWAKTGWVKNPDTKEWMFEVDNKDMSLGVWGEEIRNKEIPTVRTVDITQIPGTEKIVEAAPEIAENTMVNLHPGPHPKYPSVGGQLQQATNSEGKTYYLASVYKVSTITDKKATGVLIHELQHAIQGVQEQVGRGTNIKNATWDLSNNKTEFEYVWDAKVSEDLERVQVLKESIKTGKLSEKAVKEANTEIQKIMDAWDDTGFLDVSPHEYYEGEVGEIGARVATNRFEKDSSDATYLVRDKETGHTVSRRFTEQSSQRFSQRFPDKEVIKLEKGKGTTPFKEGERKREKAINTGGRSHQTGPRYNLQTFDPKNKDIRFNLERNKPDSDRELIAVTNTKSDKLSSIFEDGGLYVPSIAVTKKGIPFSNFGEVSFILDKNVVDPKGMGNQTFPQDAYTQRKPTAEHHIAAANVRKIVKTVENLPGADIIPGEWFPSISKMEDLEDYRHVTGVKNAYIKEKYGKEVEPVYTGGLDELKRKNPTDHEVGVWTDWATSTAEAVKVLRELDTEDLKTASKAMVQAKVKEETQEWLQGDESFGGQKGRDYRKALKEDLEEMFLNENGTLKEGFWNTLNWGGTWDRIGKAKKKTGSIDQTGTNRAMEKFLSEKKDHIDNITPWLKEKFEDIPTVKKFWDPKTKRTIKWTPTNVVKSMKHKDPRGVERGFENSPGGVRARIVKAFKSLEQMRKHRKHLVEDGSKEDADFREKFTDLLSTLNSALGSGSINDHFAADVVADFSNSPSLSEEQYLRSLNSVGREYRKDTDYSHAPGFDTAVEMIQEARKGPTTYYESKPEKLVTLDNIALAVIPEDLSKKYVKKFKDFNVPTESYNTEEDRQKIINSIDDKRVRFNLARDLGDLNPKELERILANKEGKKPVGPLDSQENFDLVVSDRSEAAFKSYEGPLDEHIIFHPTDEKFPIQRVGDIRPENRQAILLGKTDKSEALKEEPGKGFDRYKIFHKLREFDNSGSEGFKQIIDEDFNNFDKLNDDYLSAERVAEIFASNKAVKKEISLRTEGVKETVESIQAKVKAANKKYYKEYRTPTRNSEEGVTEVLASRTIKHLKTNKKVPQSMTRETWKKYLEKVKEAGVGTPEELSATKFNSWVAEDPTGKVFKEDVVKLLEDRQHYLSETRAASRENSDGDTKYETYYGLDTGTFVEGANVSFERTDVRAYDYQLLDEDQTVKSLFHVTYTDSRTGQSLKIPVAATLGRSQEATRQDYIDFNYDQDLEYYVNERTTEADDFSLIGESFPEWGEGLEWEDLTDDQKETYVSFLETAFSDFEVGPLIDEYVEMSSNFSEDLEYFGWIDNSFTGEGYDSFEEAAVAVLEELISDGEHYIENNQTFYDFFTASVASDGSRPLNATMEDKISKMGSYASYTVDGNDSEGYESILINLQPSVSETPLGKWKPTFKDPHWNADNGDVVGFIRKTDKTVEGVETLFVEEIQSDWNVKQDADKIYIDLETGKMSQKTWDDKKGEYVTETVENWQLIKQAFEEMREGVEYQASNYWHSAQLNLDRAKTEYKTAQELVASRDETYDARMKAYQEDLREFEEREAARDTEGEISMYADRMRKTIERGNPEHRKALYERGAKESKEKVLAAQNRLNSLGTSLESYKASKLGNLNQIIKQIQDEKSYENVDMSKYPDMERTELNPRLKKHLNPIKNPTSLLAKRVLAEAIESGKTRIAWTTPKQQAERYSTSLNRPGLVQVKKVPGSADLYDMKISDDSGANSRGSQRVTELGLAKHVGQGAASNIVRNINSNPEYSEGQKFYSNTANDFAYAPVGRGMTFQYDKAVPKEFEKLLKPYLGKKGAKAKKGIVDSHSVDRTNKELAATQAHIGRVYTDNLSTLDIHSNLPLLALRKSTELSEIIQREYFEDKLNPGKTTPTEFTPEELIDLLESMKKNSYIDIPTEMIEDYRNNGFSRYNLGGAEIPTGPDSQPTTPPPMDSKERAKTIIKQVEDLRNPEDNVLKRIMAIARSSGIVAKSREATLDLLEDPGNTTSAKIKENARAAQSAVETYLHESNVVFDMQEDVLSDWIAANRDDLEEIDVKTGNVGSGQDSMMEGIQEGIMTGEYPDYQDYEDKGKDKIKNLVKKNQVRLITFDGAEIALKHVGDKINAYSVDGMRLEFDPDTSIYFDIPENLAKKESKENADFVAEQNRIMETSEPGSDEYMEAFNSLWESDVRPMMVNEQLLIEKKAAEKKAAEEKEKKEEKKKGKKGKTKPLQTELALPPAEKPRPETIFDLSDENRRQSFYRSFVDRFSGIKRLENVISEKFGKLPRVAPYQALELYPGRAEEALNKIDRVADKVLKAMIKNKITPAMMSDFMYAQHAVERNKAMAKINDGTPNLSGMTDAEAVKILKDFETAGMTRTLTKIFKVLQAERNHLNQELVANGVRPENTQESYDETYEYYVPLKGTADPLKSSEGGKRSKGVQSKDTSKAAMGRKSKAQDDILATYLSDMAADAVQIEKAKVGKTVLEMVENNPNDAFWEINPKRTTKVRNKSTGEVEEVSNPYREGEPNVFSVQVEGQSKRIVFNTVEGQRLAMALNGMDQEGTNKALEILGKWNRYLGSVLTSYNPPFVISNAFRDAQTALYNIGVEQSMKMAKKTGKGVVPALKSIYRKSRGKEAGVWGEYWQEMLEAGGKTGFAAVPNTEKKLQEFQSKYDMSTAEWTKQPGTKLKKIAIDFLDLVEDMNSSVENAVRLAYYRALRDGGFSKEIAASEAKNLTVNFNRKGQYGGDINKMFLFFNAAVQGSDRIYQSYKKNPKKFKALAAMLTSVGFALGAYNQLMGGDDEESGVSYWEKVPDYTKASNFVFMIPGGKGKYVKIPMPYGHNALVSAGYRSADILFNPRVNKVNQAYGIMNDIVNAANPLGAGGSLLTMISPTVTDMAVELKMNENFAGSPIYRKPSPFSKVPAPKSEGAFKSTGAPFVAMSKGLNKLTGGDSEISGKIDINPDVLEHIWDGYTGGTGKFFKKTYETFHRGFQGEFEPAKTPFISKVYGKDNEYYDQSQFYANNSKQMTKIKQKGWQYKTRAKRLSVEAYFANDGRIPPEVNKQIKATVDKLAKESHGYVVLVKVYEKVKTQVLGKMRKARLPKEEQAIVMRFFNKLKNKILPLQAQLDKVESDSKQAEKIRKAIDLLVKKELRMLTDAL